MSAVQFDEKSVKIYLDKCITFWREKGFFGDPCAKYYVDAFQSVRMALFEERLPGDIEPIGKSAITHRDLLRKDEEDLLDTVIAFSRSCGYASALMTNRKLKIDLHTASRLIEKMRILGIVGAMDPATGHWPIILDASAKEEG